MGTRGGAGASSAAAASSSSSERLRLKVLYDFEYETKGKRVRIIKDERLILLKRTNDDWWQVVRPADVNNSFIPEQSTFYVPTGYVAELQEEALPESTRFYVDKEKMFKTTEPQEQQQQERSPEPKEEPRKAHDSFRSVIIRKLSGNLGSHNDSGNKATKPAKPSRIIKSLRKNSMDSEDAKVQSGKSSLVPAKQKDTWESSAFGMCFGRDMKNVDAQVLNPFQEELENALSNRVFTKKNILDTKVDVSKQADQDCEEQEKASKFESIQNKWEKVSAQVLKKPETSQKSDNFHFVPLSKIKEDAQKRRSGSPNYPKSETVNSANSETKQLTDTEKLEKLYSVVEKNKRCQLPDKKSNVSNKHIETALPVTNDATSDKTKIKTNDQTNDKTVIEESPTKIDKDKLLINDKRKMWAIETLMSELLQSSLNSKTIPSSENNQTGISGPNQLAQELHEMNVSRRFENAEIQVNLLDNKDDNTKENEPLNSDTKNNIESWKRKVFDFSPRSNLVKVPKSPTARSPKLLDEYNEANILNDNDRPRVMQDVNIDVLDNYESPSYSNISMRIKREKVPCKLKMPTKDFREELQLTPSLEKLASEIKFLPAISANSTDLENDKLYFDIDCPTTTLSQDSLRLYKRRSKSDGALNQHARRRDSVVSHRVQATATANNNNNNNNNNLPNNQSEAQQQQHQPVERKYEAVQQLQRVRQHQHDPDSCYCRVERGGARYNKLNRKSRSLGDLDCSDELDEKKETEAKRRYKPVPKLRSKESLRRIRPTANLVTPTASTERLSSSRPVPAKRRVQPQSQQQSQSTLGSSYDELSTIDIERSTAVGFKSLLRASDSGSEEYLQYKTFPASSRPNPRQQQHSDAGSNAEDLSRSLSDEAILSSASCCSSASPSRLLDGSLENLVDLPPGWTQSYDANAKRVCFVNDRGDKWFSSNDAEGKIYFFEENSNESSWALPTIITENRVRTVSNGDWPQLFDGNMCILKEGVINKTKITTENGKKLRKAWSSSYAVLTELFLLFFKDEKTFSSMKMDQSAAAKPDISVDLNGAFIESAEKLSNRKNVYLIQTLLGLQVLIQSDNALMSTEWYREIHDAIQRLPFSQEYGRSSSSRE